MNIFKRTSISILLFGLFGLPILAIASEMLPYLPDQGARAGRYFKDVPDEHPFAATINDLKMKGLVKGYQDETFAPDSSISRAEFITMVMASVTKNPTGSKCFKDVKDEWFAKFICAAKAKKLVAGYKDGTFKPNNNINFAEASAIIAQAHKLTKERAFTGEVWYKPFTKILEAKSAIPVTIDYPEKKMSRAETAEILWRLKTKTTNKTTKTFDSLQSPLPLISSCNELKEKIALYQFQQSKRRVIYFEGTSALPLAAPPTAALKSEGVSAGAERETSSPDYSATNVQVEGVDEADVIKNDGEFIYLLSGNTVRIVKAFPPEEMAQIAKLKFDDKNFRPSDMYVSGNRLIVLGSTYRQIDPQIEPLYYSGRSRTKVYIVDMADKNNLKEERSVEFDGSEVASRKIGHRLYLVINNAPDYFSIIKPQDNFFQALPRFQDSASRNADVPITPCNKIRFLPKYSEPNFLVVASLDIDNAQVPVQRETIMGSGQTVYASMESIYVAATQWDFPEIQKFDVWMPPAEGNEKTIIYRFGLENGAASYKSQGEVKGHLLNQFAMDEEGAAFRIATTTGEVWNRRNASKNHLFILDRNNLGTVLGKIENIAPGEKIYSVRFLGKRAYMVTFKKVDPFFVIDVEDPANPKILGELKIPGFSDYLHPFDENHIIGFGKEAVDPQEFEKARFNNDDFDFAWYQGMKIALFDVTDVANPKMMFKELIGDRGTDSELLYNHKALLYDKTRGLFAFPVTVHEIRPELKAQARLNTDSTYGDPVFQGAYIYTLDLENGFQLKGKVTHYEGGLPKECYPSGGAGEEYCYIYSKPELTVERIVYIGDYLYTISLGKLKALKRDDASEVKTALIPTDINLPDLLDDLLP